MPGSGCAGFQPCVKSSTRAKSMPRHRTLQRLRGKHGRAGVHRTQGHLGELEAGHASGLCQRAACAATAAGSVPALATLPADETTPHRHQPGQHRCPARRPGRVFAADRPARRRRGAGLARTVRHRLRLPPARQALRPVRHRRRLPGREPLAAPAPRAARALCAVALAAPAQQEPAAARLRPARGDGARPQLPLRPQRLFDLAPSAPHARADAAHRRRGRHQPPHRRRRAAPSGLERAAGGHPQRRAQLRRRTAPAAAGLGRTADDAVPVPPEPHVAVEEPAGHHRPGAAVARDDLRALRPAQRRREEAARHRAACPTCSSTSGIDDAQKAWAYAHCTGLPVPVAHRRLRPAADRGHAFRQAGVPGAAHLPAGDRRRRGRLFRRLRPGSHEAGGRTRPGAAARRRAAPMPSAPTPRSSTGTAPPPPTWRCTGGCSACRRDNRAPCASIAGSIFPARPAAR